MTSASVREFGPHVRAKLAAACTGDAGFDVGEPDVIRPAISMGFDVMDAAVVTAIDQDVARA